VRRALAVLALLSGTARAEVLRMASVAPDGTAWAHELKGLARDVSDQTEGKLTIKWYFGGIAGDDVAAGERAQRGQIDGVGSAGMLCQQLSPSMKVLRIPGLLQEPKQVSYVINRLKPTVDEEMRKAGWVNLAEVVIGSTALFSRTPVRSMADLQKQRWWRWNLDEVTNRLAEAMGIPVVRMPLESAGKAYEDKRVDGFLALPAAALAFQWSAQAKYFSDLPLDYLVGCILVSTKTYDRLSVEHRKVLAGAVAKVALRAEDVEARMRAQLFGGLFEKQGLKRVPVTPAFRDEYFTAAREARTRLAETLVPRDTLRHVLEWIADYYSQNTPRTR
jgi:TRAP-type C4-dicarboxylate transport system substrate-binding protein